MFKTYYFGMSKRKNCHEDQVLFKKINPLIQRLKAFYHGFINIS